MHVILNDVDKWAFFYSIIPESPRWLLSNGRRKEALVIVRKLVKRNGKKISEDELNTLESETETARGKIWQLFSTKTVAFRTTVICINW